MRERGLANPRAVFPRLDARPHPVAVARSVALDHLVEFLPVDFAEVVVPALLVPPDLGVGQGQAEGVRLRDGSFAFEDKMTVVR